MTKLIAMTGAALALVLLAGRLGTRRNLAAQLERSVWRGPLRRQCIAVRYGCGYNMQRDRAERRYDGPARAELGQDHIAATAIAR